ncbi:MAG TPA: HEAT repeat domain-containing protein [Arachnia sp.]|nr:HEAT repeat domain-containing protein [Arachnia sp.]
MFGPPDIKRLAARGKVGALVKALTHQDAKIRRDAATALGELRDPRAIEPLAAASRDDSLAVRDSAVWALGEIGDPAALPTLLALLREGSDRASWALEAIGEPAVGPLLEMLAADHERRVGLVIETLGKIGDARAAAPIAAFLGRPAMEAKRAQDALVALGEPAIERVVPLLRSPDPTRRWAAASTLRALGWEPASVDEATALVLAGGDLSEIRALDPAPAAPLLAEATRWSWGTDMHRAAALAKLVLSPAATTDGAARAWAADRLDQYARACDEHFKRITQSPRPDDPREREQLRAEYGDYGWLLRQAASYRHRASGDGSGGYFHAYDTVESVAAVKRLCAIDTPVTSNMLHLLTGLPDVDVASRTWECAYDADHPTGGDARYEHLSFEEQRQMAQSELARRGAPEYDVSAYAAMTGG